MSLSLQRKCWICKCEKLDSIFERLYWKCFWIFNMWENGTGFKVIMVMQENIGLNSLHILVALWWVMTLTLYVCNCAYNSTFKAMQLQFVFESSIGWIGSFGWYKTPVVAQRIYGTDINFFFFPFLKMFSCVEKKW